MVVSFSQMPDGLLFAEGCTFAAVKVYHAVFTETLGRPGWDISFRQLAVITGLNERTVKNAVEWLCESRWLIKSSTADERGNRPNLYTVCTEPGVPYGRAARPLGGGAQTTRGSAVRATPPVEALPEEETPLPPVPGEAALPLDGLPVQAAAKERAEPDFFEATWTAWGRVGSKKASMRAYAAAIKKPGVSPALLLDAVRRQRPMYDRRRADGFSLAFERWLRDEKWDQPVPAPPKRDPYAVPPDPPGWGFGV
jgi:hypothetical protein